MSCDSKRFLFKANTWTCLDELEAVVAEKENEVGLALAIVLAVLQNFQNVLRLLLRHVGVVEVLGQPPLQPVSVDVERVKRGRLAGIFAELKKQQQLLAFRAGEAFVSLTNSL